MSVDRVPSIPPGFWNLPPVRDALDRRDVGAVLGLVTDHCGMSQHALADMLEMPQPQLWAYIHGKHKPTMDTVTRIADQLAIPPRPRQRLGVTRTAGATAPKVRLSQILHLAEHIGRTNDASGLDAWREAAKAGQSDDAWTHLAQAISVQPPAQLRGPERVQVRTRGFFYAAAKLPARLVIEALTYHVDHIGLLLDTIPDPGIRRDLTLISGEASYLVACCDIDLGDPAGALSGLKVASEAARQAGDPALTAITLDGHSHFRAFTGDHHGALALVTQGLGAAATAGSPGTLAYMQLRVAEEHVALGQTSQACHLPGAWDQGVATT